jgi:benzoyl-CoA-dihydrodiol lyase
VKLTALEREFHADGVNYRYVSAKIDRARRVLHLEVRAPEGPQPTTLQDAVAAGAAWWPLQMARELDDAILHLRTNEQDVGVWLLQTRGDPREVMKSDYLLSRCSNDWFVREVKGMMRRTFARLDVTSRSLFALIDAGSCFAGSLFELALAADRSYMLDAPAGPSVTLSALNFEGLTMVNGLTRLEQRFYREEPTMGLVQQKLGQSLAASQAATMGLVTATPDELDWETELRIAIEERTSLSPDALTGMEANLRFGLYENMETRVFGRLSAWQNWIFIRPNAVGERGALKVYGKGDATAFDWQRV